MPTPHMHTARGSPNKKPSTSYTTNKSPKLHLDAQSHTSESACIRMFKGAVKTGWGVAEGSSVKGNAEEDGNGASVDGNVEAGGNGADVDVKAEADGDDVVGWSEAAKPGAAFGDIDIDGGCVGISVESGRMLVELEMPTDGNALQSVSTMSGETEGCSVKRGWGGCCGNSMPFGDCCG